MPQVSQLLSNEDYFNGLRDQDPAVLESVFSEFRRLIGRAITGNDGSEADGGVFFRTGLIEAAKAEKTPEEVPFFYFLRALSLAHFRDWRTERDQPVDLTQIVESEEGDETGLPIELPSVEELRETRYHIFAWKQFLQLEKPCRDVLEIAVGEGKTAAELAGLLKLTEDQAEKRVDDCTKKYLAQLQIRPVASLETEQSPAELPAWAMSALKDGQGLALWQKLQVLEDRHVSGAVPSAGPHKKNKTARNLFFLMLALTLGIWAYRYFTRSATPAEVYADNFTPPASLLADMEARYAKPASDSMAEPRPVQPEQCQILFQEADRAYQDKEYEAAQDPLLLMVLDSAADMTACQSDAWFYLGIIQLLQDDPQEAIQCFAKIDNLENFGEDIYWYQALALVKIATKNSSARDRATRAAQRALENTQDPQRRAQAQQMLDKLSK